MRVEEASLRLEHVPDEILLQIVSFLETRDVFLMLRANKRLHQLFLLESLWEGLLYRDFDVESNPHIEMDIHMLSTNNLVALEKGSSSFYREQYRSNFERVLHTKRRRLNQIESRKALQYRNRILQNVSKSVKVAHFTFDVGTLFFFILGFILLSSHVSPSHWVWPFFLSLALLNTGSLYTILLNYAPASLWQLADVRRKNHFGAISRLWHSTFTFQSRALCAGCALLLCFDLFCILVLLNTSGSTSFSFSTVFIPLWIVFVISLLGYPLGFLGTQAHPEKALLLLWLVLLLPLFITSVLIVVYLDTQRIEVAVVLSVLWLWQGGIFLFLVALIWYLRLDYEQEEVSYWVLTIPFCFILIPLLTFEILLVGKYDHSWNVSYYKILIPLIVLFAELLLVELRLWFRHVTTPE